MAHQKRALDEARLIAAAIERAGGSSGELQYDIEWLGAGSSSVPTTHLLSDLCGSVLEIIERCHAYMWPEVWPSTAGAKSDKVPASQQPRSTHSSRQHSPMEPVAPSVTHGLLQSCSLLVPSHEILLYGPVVS